MADEGPGKRGKSGRPKTPEAALEVREPLRRAASGHSDLPRVSGTFAHISVVNEVGQRIVRGDYPPGTILPNESEWSEMFGVGRSVVREAIKMLKAKGLLSSRPKVGSWVEPRERWNLLDRDVLTWYASSPDRHDFLMSVQEFRYIIEPEAAALAANRRSKTEMEAISTACREMATAQTLRERTAADTRFHLAILQAAGNELLLPLGALIDSALESLFVFVTREDKDLAHAQRLHANIERAIRGQQPDTAREVVRRLLENTDEIIGAEAASRAKPRGDRPHAGPGSA